MKVLFVIDSLVVGGAERSLVELLPWLHDAGISTVLVAARSRPGPLATEAEVAGSDVVVLSASTFTGKVAELHRIIRAERPTIVHTSLYLSDQLGRLAAVGTPARVVSSLVNTTYDPVRLLDPDIHRPTLEVLRRIDGWTARHLTARLHALTHAVKDSEVRALRVPPGRVTVVERGRDPVRLGEPGPERRAAARTMLGISADAPVVLTVGRHEFQKGQEHLLVAFDAVAAAHPGAQLLVAGRPGRATPALEAIRDRSRWRGSIRILGSRDDVPELLAAADVFVFPSRYEGFGGALVEAMALGVPAVVSDIPVLREVVGGDDGAVLVPPADPAALAVGIARVLDDHELARRLGAHGRQRFVERFTIGHSARALIALYGEVARGAVSAPAPVAAPRVPRGSTPALTSVVMCVRNEAADLPAQLMALGRQTFRGPWELVVCENGSTDDTRAVLDAWATRLPGLRVIDASDCAGLNASRNLGIASARGDFIAFCDGDDVVSDGWLEALVAAAPGADIVGGAVRDVAARAPDALPVKHDFLLGVPGGNCGMWATVAKELGWDESYPFAGSDIEFSWRAQLTGFTIAYAPDAVVWVRTPEQLPALARQWYRYGASGGQLFRDFRDCGMPRSRARRVAREWAWLVVHAGDACRPGEPQRHWVRRISYRAGRAAGSWRAHILYV